MTARTQSVVDFYDREANELARMYDSVDFDVVHPDILEFLPARGGRILDVGAGSGRDALALSALGYKMFAAEPSQNLRHHAMISDRSNSVTWLDDRLPNLSCTKALNLKFDFILCSAVLMLVATDELAASFKSMSKLLNVGARLVITLRSPTNSTRDALFVEHSTATLASHAAVAGFELRRMSDADDALGRTKLNWRTFVWEKRPN